MFKVNDKMYQNLKDWEEMILQATRYADKQDQCTKLEIYKDLGRLESDLYRIKAMNGMKQTGTHAESVSKKNYLQKIYKRLKKNVESSEILKSTAESKSHQDNEKSDRLTLKFENAHKFISGLTRESKGEFIEDVDQLIEKVDLKIKDYSDWSKDQINKQDEDFSVSFNKHLNELQYHRDTAAGWIKKIKDESFQNFEDFQKEFVTVLDDFQKAWKSLSSLKSIGGNYAYT